MGKKKASAASKAPHENDEPKQRGRKLNPDVLRAVEGMIAGQLRPYQIVQQISNDPRFGLSERQTHRYIARVRQSLVEDEDESKPLRRHYARASLRAILQRALSKDKLAAAVAAVDRLARLDGLYADTKIDVHHSGSIDQRLIEMPREERRSRLNELFSLYAGELKEGFDDGPLDVDVTSSN